MTAAPGPHNSSLISDKNMVFGLCLSTPGAVYMCTRMLLTRVAPHSQGRIKPYAGVVPYWIISRYGIGQGEFPFAIDADKSVVNSGSVKMAGNAAGMSEELTVLTLLSSTQIETPCSGERHVKVAASLPR